MKKEYMKPFVWGIVVGSVALLIVIFSAGWVVTSSFAENNAQEISASAVFDRLVPIAVAQFLKEPNRKEHLDELNKLEFYGSPNRSDYVQKQGWATMPGEKEPDIRIADECARQIMALEI